MNVTVVLHQPQNLVNIAAAVRAMANMGLDRLTVVDPAEFDARRITGIAHRTDAIVAAARRVQSLDEALAEFAYVVGTSARARTAQRNYHRPRDVASRIASRAIGGPVAVVFGREDRGLSNDALDRCHDVVVIPTTPEYSSLNLAHAVMLIGYELFLARPEAPDPLPTGKRSLGPATTADLEEMYRALEGGLNAVGFFRARRPKSVMRTLRTVLGRTELDAHEARLIRSIGYQVKAWARRISNITPREPPNSTSR